MKRPIRIATTALLAALVLAGCASVPSSPSVMAMPGTGKTYEMFRSDDAYCRHAALDQSEGKTPDGTATSRAVQGAAVGTLVGALAGAAIGGNHEGAGVGAGLGLLIGAASGAGAGQASAYTVQRRYDNAYVQCMYARGNKVPVPGGMAGQAGRVATPAPAVSAAPPPSYPYASSPGYRPPPPPPPSSGSSPAPRYYAPPSTVPPTGGFPPRDAPRPVY